MYETEIFKYIYELYLKNGKDARKIIGYSKVANDFVTGKISGKINNIEYNKVKEILEKQYPDLMGYVNDFSLLVVYAKKVCFNEKMNRLIKDSRPFNDEFKVLEDFYSEIANETIDVDNITISYNKDKFGQTKKMKIESPLIIKMMLYQYAKEYFISLKKYDEENWEDVISFLKFQKQEKKKPGRHKNVNTPILKAILHLFFDFTSNMKILDDTTDYVKYNLIGQLLAIAGYDSYEDYKDGDNTDSYKSHADYYSKTLKKYWKPEGTK
jgi:hypothetical protein